MHVWAACYCSWSQIGGRKLRGVGGGPPFAQQSDERGAPKSQICFHFRAVQPDLGEGGGLGGGLNLGFTMTISRERMVGIMSGTCVAPDLT